MKVSPLAAIATVLLLTGCAQPTTWVRPGATSQDFDRDSYQCEKDMRQSNYFGGGIGGAIAAQDFQKRCMRAAGWLEATASASTPLVTCKSPSGYTFRNSKDGCAAMGAEVLAP